jgi:carbon monoxide dehydrogenase subunit G
MELANTRTLAAPIAAVWQALNNPDVLKACIPGCEVFERSGESEYTLAMTARVGPVSARFSGRMTLLDVTEPTGYTLHFEGQGGAAGFANGDAKVALASVAAATTTLSYAVKAQIGGKLAQIGSRLIDGAAAKMADDFFARFAEQVAPAAAAAPPTAVAAPAKPTRSIAGPRRNSNGPYTRYMAIAAIVALLVWMYFRNHA